MGTSLVNQSYWLALDQDTRALRAGFRPGAGTPVPEPGMIEAAVLARGWTLDALDPAALANFISDCRSAVVRRSVAVGDGGNHAGDDPGRRAGSGEHAPGRALLAELSAIETAAGQLGAVVALAAAPAPSVGPAEGVAAGVTGRAAGTAGTAGAATGESVGEPAIEHVIEHVIGQVVDGSFTLDMGPDAMQVLMTLQPARGGRPVSLAQVRAALAELGVVYGVREHELLQMLEVGAGEDMLIAAGIPPAEGTPTRFETLIDEPRGTASQGGDDNALVDYRALGDLLLVTPGMRLMRRIPPSPGKDGVDVRGQPALSRAPVDIPYDEPLTGVVRDEQDREVLVAAIAGAPSFLPHGVSVNPVVEVDAVNLSSGNIDFDGTLQVRGDVTTGMQVKVTGDVVVSGTVEAAQIDAGGNVVVKGGIVGVAEGMPGVLEGAGRSAQVTARGSIQARFIGNATISAGKDVVVQTEIRQSEVLAGDSVTVGARGSSQGSIQGGQVRALKSVKAVTIGSMAGVRTFIQVGINPHAQAQREALERTRKRLTEEKGKLEQLLMVLQKHPARAANGIGERALQTHAKLLADLAALQAREAALAQDNEVAVSATIEASKKIHGGVTLQVGRGREEIVEDIGAAKASQQDGKLILR